MSAKVKTRKATIADSCAITELTAQLGYCADIAKIGERLAKILPKDNCAVFVAEEDDGAILGWIQTHAFDTVTSGLHIEIAGFIVGKEARRQGIGRILVHCAEQWAVERGAKVIVVRSNTARIESHQFYPSMGFQATKMQQVYRKNIIPRIDG